MRRLLALTAVCAAGCAPAATGGMARPTPSAAPAAAEAALISLEDRREYEPAAFAVFLADPQPAVRRRAALAAGRIRDAAAVGAVTPLLADADTSVAATAAFSLGLIGDTAAVPAIAALLSPDRMRAAPTVAAEAAGALGRLRSAAARTALEGWLRTAPREGPGVREAIGGALLAVWRFPRPADPTPILRWLDVADTAVSWRAAYALTRRPDPVGSAALAAHLDDASPLMRSFAVRALAAPLADSSGVGRPRALPRVLAATRDADHAVSVNAVRTLGTYAEPGSVDALRSLLTSPDGYLAVSAAESLGRLGTRAATAAEDLARTARDAARPIGVRVAAVAAVAAVSPSSARPLIESLAGAGEWRLRAAAGGAAADVADWTTVGEFLRDRDPRVAAITLDAAANALGDSVGRIRGLLTEALGHPDPVVRANAALALGRLADPSDLPLLLDAYDRAQRDSVLNDAALAAVGALGAIAKAHGAAPVRSFFARFPRSRDHQVRLAAAAAFGDSAARASWGAPRPIEGALTVAGAAEVVAALRGGDVPRRARMVTSRGIVELELFAEDAPLTVRSFAALARRGYFDGQEWPRVVPNFVVQGGDPRGDTSGGPGYAIRDEINRHRYLTGTLGMALSGPDTGGSQWFVTHSPQPHLDGTYAVFGRVVGGMDVVNRILPGDRIERIEVMP